MNIIQAIEDPNLFRSFLGDDLSTWANWLTALKVLHGLPLETDAERELVRQCTGRDPAKLPNEGFRTALLLVGRRSGKSRIASLIAAYEAALSGREKLLSPGELGLIPVISPTRNQSRVVREYIRAAFDSTPILQNEIADETQESFTLKSGVEVQTLVADWRTVRNFTVLAGVIDEAAFIGYAEESKVRSDTELIRALQPSLATCKGRLIAISSPYAMKGWCFGQWKKHFGNDSGKTLVWNCASRVMNPTLPQSVVDEALAEDYQAALAEYMGQFRDDVATFLPRDLIESLVVKHRHELPPKSGRKYSAFCDISGGRVDPAGVAVGHQEDGKIVIDLVRLWKAPFSPDRIVGEMVEELHRYRVDRIVGDNYSGQYVKDSFEQRGIRYARSTTNPWSKNPTAKVALPKSQLYLELLPRLCSGQVELLDNPVLVDQLAGLERRVRSGGRDSIDHGPNQHDEAANCVAGVCAVVSQRRITVGAAPLESLWTETPFERDLRRFRQRADDFNRQQERWAQGDDHQAPIRELMWRAGRGPFPFS